MAEKEPAISDKAMAEEEPAISDKAMTGEPGTSHKSVAAKPPTPHNWPPESDLIDSSRLFRHRRDQRVRANIHQRSSRRDDWGSEQDARRGRRRRDHNPCLLHD